MNTKLAALATAFLLISGCGSMNGSVKPPALPDDSSPIAGATSSGASSAGMQQASAAPTAGRTRAEVYAEALERAKHFKPTQEEERDYFNPYAR